MPARRELPDPIARSPKKAQRTSLQAHDELSERARKLGVRGRSRMRKEELARAIVRKQR